jgi:hypothetical protein
MTTVPDAGTTTPVVDPTHTPAPEPSDAADRRPPRRTGRWLEVGAVVVLLLLAVAVHRGTMGQQLVEQHNFRQTQTAMTAVDFQQHGIDLLHPRVAVFGPRSEVPFEFPLFQALATVPMNLGLNPDAALRVTAFACFVLTALLLYGLVRRVGGRLVALFTLVAFLFTPFGLQWSRAALVEFLATAGAVGFTWAGIEWRERRHWGFVVLAVVAGSLAMAVKITTAVFWILPLLLYTAMREAPGFRAWGRTRLDPGLIVAVVGPLLVGFAWTRHADAIKAADPATRWLTSANLQDWNFGTLTQRTVSQNWMNIVDHAESLITGRSLLFVVLALALWWGRRQQFWLGMVLVVVGAPLVFFNLYVQHDYYLAAVFPALAALIGLVAAQLWRLVSTKLGNPRWGAVLAGALLLVWLAWSIWPAASYLDRMYHPVADPYVEAANEVTALTPSGAPIIVLGEAWNPTMPYYAGRSAFMLTEQIEEPAVIDRLPAEGYHYVFSFDPVDDPLHVLARWPWIGVLGTRTYVVGNGRADVEGAAVIASTAHAHFAPGEPTTLSCDGTVIPIPPAGADIDVVARSRTARIWVRNDRGPLPPVGHISTDGKGELRCSGAKSIQVVVKPR